MSFVADRIKNGFAVIENHVLHCREKLIVAVRNIQQKFSRNPAYTEDVESQTYDQAPSLCSSFCAEYSGTTCLYQVCQRQCQFCKTCTCSLMDCTKSTISCFVNILCYPFIPCAVALLPTTCQNSGYIHTNNLHCCYGGTACQSETTGGRCSCCRSQACCLIWISIAITVICLLLWSLTQNSEFLIKILLFLNDLGDVPLLFCFIFLFTIVSFPMAWGYFPLNLAAGYLYGFMPAIPVVVVSVTLGVALAHVVCKRYFSSWVLTLLQRRSNFDQIEAILKVIDGSSGLKVIALTRLTPIPFGFQNGLFAVSNVKLSHYLLASNLGLLPTQVLNCYIGSTFRSMQEILDQENPGGMFFFLVQIAVGICLMLFVLRHARKELASALHSSAKSAGFDEASSTEMLAEVKVTQPTLTSPCDSASEETA